jgi:hypothetical protein
MNSMVDLRRLTRGHALAALLTASLFACGGRLAVEDADPSPDTSPDAAPLQAFACGEGVEQPSSTSTNCIYSATLDAAPVCNQGACAGAYFASCAGGGLPVGLPVSQVAAIDAGLVVPVQERDGQVVVVPDSAPFSYVCVLGGQCLRASWYDSTCSSGRAYSCASAPSGQPTAASTIYCMDGP